MEAIVKMRSMSAGSNGKKFLELMVERELKRLKSNVLQTSCTSALLIPFQILLTIIKSKYCQSNYYSNIKDSLVENPSKIMLQINFAENYATVWQDEIQSAHCMKMFATHL